MLKKVLQNVILCFQKQQHQTFWRKNMTQLDLFNKGCAAIQKKITEIFKPAHLTIIARSTKFIQRATNCLQAIDFLMLMTACSMQNVTTSLERLCFELRKLNPNANITKQSMMEKINQPEATHFLKSVFEVIVQQKIEAITQDISPEIFSQFGRVLIEDCTECSLNEELQEKFKGSGGSGSKSSVKIHFVYDLKTRSIISIEIGDRRRPDQKIAQQNIEMINNGDLIIRDLGFFDANNMGKINAKGAFFVSRLPATAVVFINKDDLESVDLAKYIDKHFPNQRIIDLGEIYVTNDKVPFRLVAYRAPQELADKRRREANQEAKKKGRTPKASTLNRLDFTFLLTNVPKEIFSADILGTVYSVRWQIELIFKCWKSNLKIHYLKGINPNRILCLIYAKLIIVLISNMLYQAACLYANFLRREVSFFKLVCWLISGDRLSMIIQKGLSKQFINCFLIEISKTLCKDKRKRKTTLEALELEMGFFDLRKNFDKQPNENKLFKAA
jgi:hypothetical protein